MSPLRALIILADGFEEVEAITPADVLRRAGMEVDLVGLPGPECRGAHDIFVEETTKFEAAKQKTYDVILLPGGLPGASNIAKNNEAIEMLKKQAKEGRWTAAICASPALVLCEMNLMGDAKGVCYPAMKDRMGKHHAGDGIDVHVDGKIITACGPASAMGWSIRIVKEVCGQEKAKEVADALLFKC